MPGLRLDINVTQAQKDLADALSKMRAAASTPITAKLAVDTSALERAESKFKALRREIMKPIKMDIMGDSSGSSGLTKDVNKQIKQIDKWSDALAKGEKKVNDLTRTYRKTLDTRGLINVDQYSKELKKLQSLSGKAKEALDTIQFKKENGIGLSDKDLYDFNKITKQINDGVNQVKSVNSRIKADDIVGSSKMYQQIDKSLNSVLATREKLEKAQKNRSSFNNAGITQQIDELSKIEPALSRAMGSLSNMDGVVPLNDALNFNQLTKDADDAVSRIESSFKKLDSAVTSTDLESKQMRAFDKLGNRMTTYFNQYESQILRNADVYDKYRTTLSKIQSGSYATIEDANNAFASFRMEARRAGVEVESFGSRMEQTFGVRVRSALAGEGVWMLESALRDVVANAIDVDTAMTEVKKVTNETDSTYTKFLSDAGNRAQNLGATLTEVVNATADYARLGYSLEDATGLADSAILYQNVGDDVENIDAATSSLISTMQGFGIAASDSMSIVDKFNNVSNNYASSAGDIGEITKRSASAMAAANNDLDETIAIGVAANTVKNCLAS